MINVIKFNGGLGNQMFQYAMYLALKKNNRLSFFLFDINKSCNCHNGFELTKIFPSIGFNEIRLYKLIQAFCPKILQNLKIVKQPNSLTYYPELKKNMAGNIAYEGYWQTEQYFLDVQSKVRSAFKFDLDLLNSFTKQLSEEILKDDESVSIHIRRGDYLRESFRLTCTLEYYKRAIDLIKSKCRIPKFYVFSDDINWVKENLSITNAEYIGWNKGEDSWQDMYLMSLCRHNIIANSSFSWWGAWLNSNVDKYVIAPKLWFNDRNRQDIIPQSWIKI